MLVYVLTLEVKGMRYTTEILADESPMMLMQDIKHLVWADESPVHVEPVQSTQKWECEMLSHSHHHLK